MPIERFDGHFLSAVEPAPEAWHRQAAFVELDFADAFDDFGIDDDRDLVVDVDHGQAQGDADLGRSQTNPRGNLHRLDHVVDELLNLPIDLGDLFGFLTQNGIADDEDGPNHRGWGFGVRD